MQNTCDSILRAALYLILLSAGSAVADVPAFARSCVGCHGADGISSQPKVPTIAGISAPVHADMLFAYKDGAYPCPTSAMCGLSARLSEEEIEQIAAYFAGLPFMAASQQADPEKAKLGKEIHDAKCEQCHTEGGSNPDDDASILAGQWMEYLRTVLAEYAAGKREQPKAMQAKLEKLSQDEIEALVHYYGSGK